MPNFIGPDGKVHEFTDAATSPDALAELTANGFRLESEAPQTTGEKIQSAVFDPAMASSEGALSGLTAGLIDTGAALGPQFPGQPFRATEERREMNKFAREEKTRRAEENPISHGVGEFAGMLASPVGEIGKGAEVAVGAKTVLGKVGAATVRGGVEGSLFGAGNTVSAAALGDEELTAEKLMVGAGLGAVLGAGGGGLGAGFVEGGKTLISKGLKSAGEVDLGKFAQERWLKASGGIQRDIAKVPAAEHGAVADVLRKHLGPTAKLDEAFETMASERNEALRGVLKQAGVTDAEKLTAEMGRDEALGALKGMQETEGKKFGSILEQADKAGAKPEFHRLDQRLLAFEDALNPAEKDLVSGQVSKVRKFLVDMASQPLDSDKAGFAALNDIKSTLQKDAYRLADGAAATDLRRQLVGVLRDEIDTQLAPQIGSDLSKEYLQGKEAFGLLSRAEDALSKKSATGADAAGSIIEELGLATPEAKRFAAVNHAMNLTKHGMERSLGSRAVSPTDYLTGIGAGLLHGNPAGVLTGIGSALTHKLFRENGSRLVAKLADQLTKSPALSAIATSFTQKAAQAPQLGQYASRLAEAAALSPQHALATHMVMAQADPNYALHANMAGFLPEDAAEHEGALVRGHGIAQLAAATAAHDEDFDRHLDAVFRGEKAPPVLGGGKDFGAKRMRKGVKDGHEERVDEVMRLAADPGALLERVTGNMGNMGNVAPGVAAALTQKANAAVQYLSSQAQQPQPGGPLAAKWAPSEAEKQTFARKYHTVVDPMSALKHAAAGTLTSDEMQALKAVYPRLARLASDKLLERMAGHGKAVPYRAKLMLGMLSGVSPDGTSTGLAIARNQAAINAPSRKADAQGLGDGGKSGQDFKAANRMATPGQRREMRED